MLFLYGIDLLTDIVLLKNSHEDNYYLTYTLLNVKWGVFILYYYFQSTKPSVTDMRVVV